MTRHWLLLLAPLLCLATAGNQAPVGCDDPPKMPGGIEAGVPDPLGPITETPADFPPAIAGNTCSYCYAWNACPGGVATEHREGNSGRHGRCPGSSAPCR